jgi:hypothetical protein
MSLKGDKYETQEEVNFRLNNTVVLYDGKPVYITRVNIPEVEDKKEIARVFFVELPYGKKLGDGAKETRKYLSSRKFDISPFRMGYFNHNGEAIFASRTPVRQNQQGLNAKNVTFVDARGRRAENMNFNEIIKSQGFVDMVNGVFPDFAAAGDMLGNKDNSSIAVSRSFAFHVDHDLEALLLLHKGIRCGIALKGDRALKVPPKFHFLREEMEQCRIPLA